MTFLRKYGHYVPSLFASIVFLQSLFFKFRDSPETRYIFEQRLEPWAASLGHPGTFAPGCIFSAHVIGSVELVASVLILAGTFAAKVRYLQGIGAAIGLAIITGAIFFHLGPLGIAVQGDDGKSDGGLLFGLACGVWVSCATLLLLRRHDLLALLGMGGAGVPLAAGR